MAGPPEEPYEILEFGRRPLPQPVSDPDEEPPEPPSARDWQRFLRLGLAFAVGAAVGAYGWDQWRDREQVAADSASAVLVGGVTSSQPHDDGTVQFSVVVENLGGAAVRIDELIVPGWQRPAGRALLDVEIPSSGTESVADEAIVDCDAPLPDEVLAAVRTADGVHREVAIRLPGSDGPFGWPHTAICTTPEGGVMAFPEIALEKAPDFVRTSVSIQNYTPERLVVTEVTSPSIAFEIEALDLPWEVGAASGVAGPGQASGQVIWRVKDCRAAAHSMLDDFYLSLATNGQPAATGYGGWTESPAVAELIRLGLTACQ